MYVYYGTFVICVFIVFQFGRVFKGMWLYMCVVILRMCVLMIMRCVCTWYVLYCSSGIRCVFMDFVEIPGVLGKVLWGQCFIT